MNKNVLVIGGGGYVGTELVKLLLKKGYFVTVYDLFIYGNNLSSHKNLKIVRGDIRNIEQLTQEVKLVKNVIHLACISNDPSYELNPELSKSINYDCFEPLIKICKKYSVKKFIYASSSSVYGIKSEPNVSEDMELNPLTDYSKFKAKCEEVVLRYASSDFVCTILRPATVCGYSSRLRLDVVVNILTNLAVNKGEISIFGGKQLRPNIHIKDMIKSYNDILDAKESNINKEIFNVGSVNISVEDIALTVREIVGNNVKLKYVPTDDHRSYHVNSEKISQIINFKTEYSINKAVEDLVEAFDKNLIKDSLNNDLYFNIKRMQNINLT